MICDKENIVDVSFIQPYLVEINQHTCYITYIYKTQLSQF